MMFFATSIANDVLSKGP